MNLLPLVNSMPSSYEKLGKDVLKTGKGNFDAKVDKKGPFSIGALAEIKLEAAKPARSRTRPSRSLRKKTRLTWRFTAIWILLTTPTSISSATATCF